MAKALPAIGDIGVFSKSGSTVRVAGHCTEASYGGLIEVERVDTGKAMLINPAAFEPKTQETHS